MTRADREMMRAIVAVVCKSLGVELEELGDRGRMPRVVLAREMIAYLGRHLTQCSYPQIAVHIGKSAHSSIVYGHHRMIDRLAAGERMAWNGKVVEMGEVVAGLTHLARNYYAPQPTAGSHAADTVGYRTAGLA